MLCSISGSQCCFSFIAYVLLIKIIDLLLRRRFSFASHRFLSHRAARYKLQRVYDAFNYKHIKENICSEFSSASSFPAHSSLAGLFLLPLRRDSFAVYCLVLQIFFRLLVRSIYARFQSLRSTDVITERCVNIYCPRTFQVFSWVFFSFRQQETSKGKFIPNNNNFLSFFWRISL